MIARVGQQMLESVARMMSLRVWRTRSAAR